MPQVAHFGAGQRIDHRYDIRGPLGQGGLAEVVRAWDLLFEREVAIKVLRFSSHEARETFRNEFLLLCSHQHPRLARCLDFASTRTLGEPVDYYTAELIDGMPLDQAASSSPDSDLLAPLIHALEALAWLHSAGIMHGDFKPSNVLVRNDGAGFLIDLSAARRIDRTSLPTGDVSGTHGFIAPEILAGHPPDQRADLYGVGKTLDQLATSSRRPLPSRTRKLIERLTRSDPSQRPSSVLEVLEALGHPTRSMALPSEPGRLVGRVDCVARFRELLDRLRAGKPGPRAMLVTGPEGAGKTRLSRELIWTAQLEIAVVEGAPTGTTWLHDLLGRALGRSLQGGIDTLLQAREELARAPEPHLLAIDDADRLAASERQLLAAMVRAKTDQDTLAWLIAGRDLAAEADAWLQTLGALEGKDVACWVGRFVDASRVPQVVDRTGGMPGALRDLCGALARGQLREASLGSFTSSAAGEPPSAQALSWSLAASRAAATLAIIEGQAAPDLLTALGVQSDALAELEWEGVACNQGGWWRWLHPGRARAWIEALPGAVVQQASGELARHASTRAARQGASLAERSEAEALGVRGEWVAGRRQAAVERALASEPLFEWAPQAWHSTLSTWMTVAGMAAEPFLRAAGMEASGDMLGALGLLARSLRKRPAPAKAAVLAWRAARCYEKLGKVDRALRQIARADALSMEPTLRAATTVVRSRCLQRMGRHGEAVTAANDMLANHPGAAIEGELHEVLGLAWGYLGDATKASWHLGQAVQLASETTSPRALVRRLSYQGIQEFRAGEPRKAAARFEHVLSVVEQHLLGDLVSTTALNLGTAAHQYGDWGKALACYQRGLRASIAYGKRRTELTLRFNLAKLHADMGLYEQADSGLGGVEKEAAARGMPELLGASQGVRAEIAFGSGKLQQAARMFDLARSTHAQRQSKREMCECDLQAAEVAVDAGDLTSAESVLSRGEALMADLEAADLQLRRALVRGSLAAAMGDTQLAQTWMERAAEPSERAGQLELTAQLELKTSEVYEARGAHRLSQRHRSVAAESWERIASTLPQEHIESFWRHGQRSRARTLPASHGPDELRWARMLRLVEINRHLSSTLDTDEVLRLAMDAAVELTGAERGFVILRTQAGHPGAGKLHVPVARNIDRERIGKSHLKFSQGIARRVLETGDPVLTVDALSDERFNTNASVHAMRLRSIVCVPIRAHGQTLGALYVDNRFQSGRFSPDDRELLSAFADQVAIALHNGRVLEDLRARTQELEQERSKVEQRLQERTTELERLGQQLERERERGPSQAHYAGILGQSEAMRRVFTVIEKVADSDVPVLIEGESGTGKEVVARAIHKQGWRREGPFVAINCAALPEALLESELFGHVKGAFTGATRDHPGLMVAARDGILFLDELGETSPQVQAKLLRALQEREVRPVGGDKPVALGDMRLVCATNRRLREEIDAGRFRQDLYYRISVVEIELPPLRERMEDLPLIAQAFLEKMAARQGQGTAARRLSRGALRKLLGYGWPGNVRQLENVLSRSAVLSLGDEIGPEDLELAPMGHVRSRALSRDEFHKEEGSRIRAALHQHGWNVSEVSRVLGIPRMSLYRKLRRHGLLERPPSS